MDATTPRELREKIVVAGGKVGDQTVEAETNLPPFFRALAATGVVGSRAPMDGVGPLCRERVVSGL